MRAALILSLFLITALALPQLDAAFTLTGSTADAKITVTGETPLEITIPAHATIDGANYSDGTAVFSDVFSYSYSDPGLLADTSGGKLFLFVLDQPTEFNYSVAVLLPETRVFSSAAPDPAYFSDGQRIGALWRGSGSSAQFSAKYNSPVGPIIHFIQTDIPIIDKTIFLPGIILAFLFGYFLAAGAVAALFQRIRLITAGMSQDESAIVNLLRDGPLAQSAIQKKLDFSKAKLSRTLRVMEERKIIKKTPKGKANVVSLN